MMIISIDIAGEKGIVLEFQFFLCYCISCPKLKTMYRVEFSQYADMRSGDTTQKRHLPRTIDTVFKDQDIIRFGSRRLECLHNDFQNSDHPWHGWCSFFDLEDTQGHTEFSIEVFWTSVDAELISQMSLEYIIDDHPTRCFAHRSIDTDDQRLSLRQITTSESSEQLIIFEEEEGFHQIDN